MVQTIKAYVSMDFHPRLEQPPMVKFYARVSSRVPFLYLKNKHPNLAFLSGRLTSSSDLALSRSFSVQRSFFRGDVISITSWAPDVSPPLYALRFLTCVAKITKTPVPDQRPTTVSIECSTVLSHQKA